MDFLFIYVIKQRYCNYLIEKSCLIEGYKAKVKYIISLAICTLICKTFRAIYIINELIILYNKINLRKTDSASEIYSRFSYNWLHYRQYSKAIEDFINACMFLLGSPFT